MRGAGIPVWMFDRAACASDVRFAFEPFVGLDGLAHCPRSQFGVEDQRAIIECPALGRIWVSREQNGGEP